MLNAGHREEGEQFMALVFTQRGIHWSSHQLHIQENSTISEQLNRSRNSFIKLKLITSRVTRVEGGERGGSKLERKIESDAVRE